MDFSDNPDHIALRDAISAVTRPFGGPYFAQHGERHQPTDELWHALGKQGFIGINLPEEFGGGADSVPQAFLPSISK